MTITNSGNDVEQLELLYIPGGDAECLAQPLYLENSSQFLIQQLDKPLPYVQYSHTYLPKWNENLYRNMYMNVYNDLIPNCPKWEVTQMSFNQLMDESVVHAHNGLLLCHEKEPTIDTLEQHR